MQFPSGNHRCLANTFKRQPLSFSRFYTSCAERTVTLIPILINPIYLMPYFSIKLMPALTLHNLSPHIPIWLFPQFFSFPRDVVSHHRCSTTHNLLDSVKFFLCDNWRMCSFDLRQLNIAKISYLFLDKVIRSILVSARVFCRPEVNVYCQ